MNLSTVPRTICFLATILASVPLFAQSETAAVVNEQTISLDAVHHFLDRSLANLPKFANREDRSAAVVQAGIQHCVNREVILQFLQSGSFKTSEQEVDRQVEELETQLKSTGSTLEEHLKKLRLSLPELRREQLWITSWRKYATKFVTAEHLEKQFESKRKYFDGTKVHVAQILLKINTTGTVTKAQTILDQLNSKKLSWSDAVKQHSESASASNEGDLGWIEYSGPMPRPFTQRAFELEPGEFSKPHTSKYGVHLIRCIEVVKGNKSFEDVATQLREIETNRLFQLVAKRNRDAARVKIPSISPDGKSDSKK